MNTFFIVLLPVLGGILLLITVILCLPLHVFIKYDKELGLSLTGRLLLLRLGEKPDPEGTALKTAASILGAKELGGIDELKKGLADRGTAEVVSRVLAVLRSLFGRVLWILKYCRLKRLAVKAVCAAPDAAEAAMDYGAASAVIYPAVGLLSTAMKPVGKPLDIRLSCGFDNAEKEFALDMHIAVRLIFIVRALLKIIIDNTRRELDRAGEAGNRPSAADGNGNKQ